MTYEVSVLLLGNLALSWLLTGLLATTQAVSYPLLSHVPRAEFAVFHAAYTRRIGFLVGPVMILELGCAVAFSLIEGTAWGQTALLMVLLGWTVTVVIALRGHRLLATVWDDKAYRLLLVGNAFRLILWGARSLVLSVIVWQAVLN